MISLPRSRMDPISFNSPSSLHQFFFMFMVIYLLGYFVVFRNWTSKQRPEASSCLISLFHGTPAAFMAIHAITRSQTPHTFASANTASHNMVLEFSMAYFMADLLHFFLFFPNDVLFIAHHLATLFVFATCRYVAGHGACALLVLLVIAEATSACQNAWTLAGARRGDVPVAAKVYEILRFPFYGLYSVARGVLGPLFVCEMGVFYVSGGAAGVIPRWVWVSWMMVIVTAIIVSISWVLNLWAELYAERIKKVQKN